MFFPYLIEPVYKRQHGREALLSYLSVGFIGRAMNEEEKGTVGKTYVASTLSRHRQLILEARRKFKHQVPRAMPRNLIWGMDLLTKTDTTGRPHLALAIVDHASRASLCVRRLTDKSSWTIWHALVTTCRQYGCPCVLRTDNEAVFVSRAFRLGLWLLGVRHQRSQP
ncbi:MAG: DDE-type integrase/transposase/recombinase, partial [Nitrospira sp.]|nr:DDE-type integrase/transposase/recombinase [Nitrospira sp.]